MEWITELIWESLSGIIVIWSGAIVDIPDGWVLCDGTQGTPDLRDRFVVGAGLTYTVGETGGSNNHNHDFDSDGHWHTLGMGYAVQSGTGRAITTNQVADGGTTDNEDGRPPYYALAYIMKT